MYLYRYILIAASVFLMSIPVSASNRAISSQSYDRGDVSLSYKFNLIHLYTTSKPYHYTRYVRNHEQQNKGLPEKDSPLVNFQKIQYAPLSLKIQEQRRNQSKDQDLTLPEHQNTEISTEDSTSAYDNMNNENSESHQEQEQKRDLAPRADLDESSNARPRKYVPGYNVDLQAVNNKLLQNGFYASNPNFLVKNKQVNVNYLQPQATYKKQENLQGLSQSKEAKAKEPYSVITYHYPQDFKKYNENLLPGKEHNVKPPFFYVKAPKVELNLARAHHIARTVHKAPVNVNSSFRKLPSLPQEFFSNPQIFQPPKTVLYPVQSNSKYIARRTATV